MWPHEDILSLNAFYGDPRGANGKISPTWEATNVVRWIPPYPLFFSDGQHTPLLHLGVHRKCLSTFDAAYREVLETLGHNYIVAHRLDISGGLGNFRLERGGSRLSVHSWYIAIDMDPGRNPFPRKWAPNCGMIDQKFIEVMQKHGFCWRGAGHDDDPMHFQLCNH